MVQTACAPTKGLENMASTDTHLVLDLSSDDGVPTMLVVPEKEVVLAYGWRERFSTALITAINKLKPEEYFYFDASWQGRALVVSGASKKLARMVTKAAKAALVAPPELEFLVREVNSPDGTVTTLFFKGKVDFTRVVYPVMPEGTTVIQDCARNRVDIGAKNPMYGPHDDTVANVQAALQRASVPA